VLVNGGLIRGLRNGSVSPSRRARTRPRKARKRIAKLLKEWIENGALEVVEKEDDQRRPRKFVVVGKWAVE
jgi:hypothetical protein